MIFNYIEEKSLKILNEFDLLKYPINVNKLAKKLGVGVEASNFNDEVSGLFVIKGTYFRNQASQAVPRP